jgi:hypothetical protein
MPSSEQFALAAAEVEHSCGARRLQRFEYGIEPPFVDPLDTFHTKLVSLFETVQIPVPQFHLPPR